ncbi:NAD(P)/FAD-dependent oxidoreductase [Actinacidiphila paucisporea]|uniref:Dehydrogenase (Flavoprotein) n=1 Tax=Actinacidiphila paucisporea TaxID=310782 RepID=A0A1M7BRC1_9ACTN|nr:FAD-dependent monooxygenase [Actinacidiphila paucisporea]SHL57578.1 Dehydrogenase (flavoprotein) [Actinacidiphila paucisporea]
MRGERGRRAPRGRALVIGGSLTGMLAAGALAETMEVTVVERHDMPHGPLPRQGVPQARHAHLLWSGGARAVEALLPGATERLLKAGARHIAVPKDLVVLTSGGWITRFPEQQHFLACTRDLLDWVVRDLVVRKPRVRTLPGHAALGLRGTSTRVTGVVVRGARREETLEADLVVDASGRASAMPRWLDRLGLPAVRTDVVDSGLGYASRLFHAPPGTDGFPAVNVQADPRQPVPGLNGTILPVEDGRWLVTLSGTQGGRPTGEAAGFEAFARSLRHPVIADLLSRATPLTEVTVSHSTANRRRRYERMRVWPDGLVVLGDALATYNPLYGHGMSVAAQHALLLREQVARDPGPGLARRVQRAASRAADAAWALAGTQDLRYPGAEGRSPGPFGAVMNGYTDRLMLAATHRRGAARALLDVLSLSAGQAALLRPDVLARVLYPVHPEQSADPPFTEEERALMISLFTGR